MRCAIGLVWILCVGVVMSTFGADSVELARDGKSTTVIVLPEQTEWDALLAQIATDVAPAVDERSPANDDQRAKWIADEIRSRTPKTGDEEVLAAEELQLFIRKVTGAELAIVRAADGKLPDGNAIVLGTTLARAAGYGEVLDGLHKDGFMAKAAGTRIYLSGRRARGTLYAAYELLETMGCRWFMPGEFGELLPSEPTVTLAIDTVQNPSHDQRYWWCTYGNGKDYPRWTLRNKGNFVPAVGDPRVEQGHALAGPLRWAAKNPDYAETVVDADGKESLKLPDEYYAMVAGKPSGHIPNMSNPKVWDMYAAYYATLPGPYVSASIEDAIMNDDRATTRALDSMEYDYLMGAMSGTDRLWFFYNRILERLEKKRPDLKLGMLVYSNLMTPPRVERLHKNMALVIAPLSVCPLHHIRDPKCKSNRGYAVWLEAWLAQAEAAGAEAYYYDYEPLGYSWNVAMVSPRWAIIGRNYPWMQKMGLDGHTTQGYDDWASCGLDNWTMQRLYWNVDQDYRDILVDYCNRRFGKAGPAMIEYFTIMEKRMEEIPDLTSNEVWGNVLVMTPEVRAACRAALDRAVAAADTDRDKAQVHTMVLLQRSTDGFMNGLELARETGDFAKAYEMMAVTFDVADELNKHYSHFMNPARVKREGKEHFLTGGMWNHTKRMADTIAAAKAHVILPREMVIALDSGNTAWTKGWHLPGADVSAATTGDSTLIPDVTFGTQREVAAFFYRTDVEAPQAVAESKKTILYFPSLIAKAVQIWVNGEPMTFDHGDYSDATWRGPDYFWINYDHQVAFDISGALKPGTNTIAFRVFKSFDHGGSYNRIFILADPKIDATPSR